MKKILLISNHGGGFYNFKKELVLELLSQGYEVHFAVPWHERLLKMTESGACFHELFIDRRGINPVKDLGFIKQLNRLLNKINPDILLFHTIKPNIYGSLIAKRKKISYINNITGLGSALQNESKLAKILRCMYRSALNKSSGIFFENQGNCDYFSRHNIGKAEQYVVVKGAGVNTEHFKPCGKEENDSENKHESENVKQVGSDIVRFLFIARIMKEKGIEEYLEAARHIKSIHCRTEFQILGDYDEPELKEKVEKYVRDGVINFLGTSNDTRIEMAKTDCIVLPSYHEGMSNVLLEGASMGLPLITTNIPGCREAVESLKTGVLCEPKNAESLIAALETFLDLTDIQRKEMGACGREKMIKEFDRKLVVEKYIKCIKKAL